MDAIDRAILTHLEGEGRLSNTELAERVHLSPSPCLRRVRKLERTGVITGYHAAVDPSAIGRGFQVLLHVEMAIQDRKTTEAFEAEVAQLDEVIEALRMFGRPDYLLWIAVTDQDAYERLLMDRLASLPGVGRTNSQFTMKTIKGAARVPAAHRLPPAPNR
jgi:Lrp/AsnC family transcriptional regulator, leucine-responsive regulatory protein